MDDFDNDVEDNFAMRMASYQHEEDQEALDDHNGYNISSEALNEEETLWDRRNFLQGMVTATAAGLAMPSSSNAFEKKHIQSHWTLKTMIRLETWKQFVNNAFQFKKPKSSNLKMIYCSNP